MMLIYMIRVLFVLFFVYTVIYLFQMGISLCISIYRLEKYKKNKTLNRELFPTAFAKRIPVSVIIPAYNEAACITETIEALFEEDYPNLEIIVVDDGSNDNMESLVVKRFGLIKEPVLSEFELKAKPILRQYRKVFDEKTLIFIHKENGGKSDALNCGLNICHSPYCVMLDADTKVQRGSIRIMMSCFLMNPKTIVCAGAVGSENLKNYPKLTFLKKALVVFQILEYYRTFYMQRIMFDHINANIIVSGAFAMFDTDLVKRVGGYQVNTIGEDMELTMRLHAFCASQGKEYHIAYAPEAKCMTQLPFTYKDYYHQRRRWHIGLLQSMKFHKYMLGNKNYGWAGITSGTFFILYELLAPFLEIIGVATLIAANLLDILNLQFTIQATILYTLIVIWIQAILVSAVNRYKVEPINGKQRWILFLISIFEIVFFHPLNIVIKIIATAMNYWYRKSWEHIQRIETNR